ncbi:MAG TPA: alcohol dehydrogenase catalytic domain-containing protein [Phycisphaerales bacterium]|nr:alcohol dehydrogenase catalytic domain-containing protein [Phycisphaerales bacterium]
MRALRYEPSTAGGPGRVRFATDVDAPSLGPGEALIRPLLVGISATDLRLARGQSPESERPTSAITLGHEFVGVVEQVNAGPGQERRAKELNGQRVVGAINIVCGKCDLCRAGLSNHCRSRSVLGLHGRDGCFADRFCSPLNNLHVVPRELDDDHAVFAEPLSAASHAAQQLRIEGKPYVTVLGDGRMALLCAQLMVKRNASVRVIGDDERKLALCEKWGIKHRPASDAGRRADQDVVIDCTNSAAGLDLALRLVRPRGKVLLKGVSAPLGDESRGGSPMSTVDLSLISINEIEVIGSRCGSIAEALTLLRRGEVDVLSLITRRFKLDDAAEALKFAARPEAVQVVMEV